MKKNVGLKKTSPSTKAALELAPIEFPNSKSKAILPTANQIALTSALVPNKNTRNPNTLMSNVNSSS